MRKLIPVLFFFASPLVFALSRKGEFQSTKVGFTQQNFTGVDKQSFSGGDSSYGGELSIDSGGQYLRYFFKTRIVSSIGSQAFIKSGVTYNSKYVYTSITPELGAALFPVSRKDKGVNIYVWGVAGVSYDNLTINSVPVGVDVESKAQKFGSGYGAGMGFETIVYASRGGKKIMVYSEVGFRDYRTPLAGLNSFEVSGMTFSLGFGF